MSNGQPKATLSSSWLAGAGVLLSILVCYGSLALIAILSLMGISLVINVHIWAAAIVFLAFVALLGVTLGYRSHGSIGPLCVAALGTLFVVLAMYGTKFLNAQLGINTRAVELVGFAALLIAAIWDWRLKFSKKRTY